MRATPAPSTMNAVKSVKNARPRRKSRLTPFGIPNASLIASNDFAAGPGHCFVLQTPGGGWWMLYHAWEPGAVGDEATGRQLWLSRVAFGDDGTVTVDPPTAQLPVRPEG